MKRVLLFTFLLITVCIHADVRYVSKNGSSTPPYLTWETAADSIQKCINICNSGDTVYVGSGTYKEKIIMKAGISLIGNGMDSCIIDTREFPQDPQIMAVTVDDNFLFAGFSLLVSPPTGKQSYGIWSVCPVPFSHYSGTIANNKIVGGGIAVVSQSSALIIKDNIINNFDLGIVISSNFDYPQLVENNYIGFIRIGVEISGSKPVIKNNIFYNKQNGFNYGHAIFEMSLSPNDTVKVFNNIAITFNYSQFILTTTTRPYQVINNVIMGNYYQGFCIVPQNILINNLAIGGYIGFKFFPDYGPPIKIAYNNGYRNQANYDGFTPDSTNLSVDPMIVSEDSIQDFHLQMFSRMIDKGDPSIIDLDGTRSDIGAYGGPYGESYEYLDYPPKTPLIYYAIKQSDGIRLGWKVSTETDFHSYLIYRDTTTDFTADSTKLIAELSNSNYLDTLPISSNKLYYKIRAKDNQGKVSNASKEIAVIINNVTGDKEINPVLDYELYQNYPNPFNPGTIIPYRLKERGYVKLMVYDIKGELVTVLVNQEQEPGYYEAEFRAEHKTSGDWIEKIASGIYLYTIEVKNGSNIPIYNEMKKMLLVK